MASITAAMTEDITSDGDRTQDDTDSSTSAEDSNEPPCRVAGRFLVQCPICGRRVQVRTLRYSHVCRRTFNPLERALEQKKAAEAAVRARQTQVVQKTRQNTTRENKESQRYVRRHMFRNAVWDTQREIGSGTTGVLQFVEKENTKESKREPVYRRGLAFDGAFSRAVARQLQYVKPTACLYPCCRLQ